VSRGMFQITGRGRELLRLNPERLSLKMLLGQDGVPLEAATPVDRESVLTPEEQMDSSFQVLRQALSADLLDAARKSTPAFFEKLVVELLVAMGYGGSMEDAGKAVGRTGDEGIDGIIKEDKLGLEFVYVQAKNWEGTVGRPTVQAFAGSLEGRRARKGVLITTSEFSREALEYVKKIEKKIVLIDGHQLADFMIEYGVAVTEEKVYYLKRIDRGYFEETE
jgi:restriction system protein